MSSLRTEQPPAGPALPPALTATEVHSGMVFGPAHGPAPAVGQEPGGDPRIVLDEVLADALSTPPCHVTFSGGRDSSVILAAAVRVARTQGLPDPIPLTAVYPAVPTTWEEPWQRRTLGLLGLTEWHRTEVQGEIELLSPLATELLRRYGSYWPSNLHSVRHLAGVAGGGTILTGGGGDELFSRWHWQRRSLRELKARRSGPRAGARFALQALPVRARQRLDRGGAVVTPWMQPDVARRLLAEQAGLRAGTASFLEEADVFLRSRYRELLGGWTRRFAHDANARFVEPFYEPRVVRSFAAGGPRDGFRSRTHAMEFFFSDLLPTDVLGRSTKAVFGGALWGPRTREYAATADMSALDERLVDPSALRAVWLRARSDGRAAAALQHVWLTECGGAFSSSTS